MYRGMQIPSVPCIIPRPTAAPSHQYSAFAVGAPEITSRGGVYRLYEQAVNIKTEQLSEINLDHKNATAFIEIRLTIRWALLGFKEKNAEVIDNIIKSFRARTTIEAGLSAIVAYLQTVFVQNAGVQDYSTSVPSMQHAVTCTVNQVSYDLIEGEFQDRTETRQGVML